MEGTVKFFNRKKGFGFITGDNGKDYYVHATSIASDEVIYDDDVVSFSPENSNKGMAAKNVAILDEGRELQSEENDITESKESSLSLHSIMFAGLFGIVIMWASAVIWLQ